MQRASRDQRGACGCRLVGFPCTCGLLKGHRHSPVFSRARWHLGGQPPICPLVNPEHLKQSASCAKTATCAEMCVAVMRSVCVCVFSPVQKRATRDKESGTAQESAAERAQDSTRNLIDADHHNHKEKKGVGEGRGADTEGDTDFESIPSEVTAGCSVKRPTAKKHENEQHNCRNTQTTCLLVFQEKNFFF